MEAIDFIRSGKLGDYGPFEPLIRDIFEGKDHCKPALCMTILE